MLPKSTLGLGEGAPRPTRASVTFLVHDGRPPQRYVAVEGPAVVEPADPGIRRAIAERYLPPEMIDGFLAITPSEDLVLIRITPQRWRTSDFSKIEPAA